MTKYLTATLMIYSSVFCCLNASERSEFEAQKVEVSSTEVSASQHF